jgi:hypothetical protein
VLCRLTRAVVGTVGYLLPSWGYLGTGSNQTLDPFLPPNKKSHSSQVSHTYLPSRVGSALLNPPFILPLCEAAV